ncbi:MAG: ATP synthase subunit I [Undibacterium curvum]|uniref:ATP synthase subunit I n=1 Tax=Undibacterium curvum TaxID=2762294 RepID=UPI003BBA27FF
MITCDKTVQFLGEIGAHPQLCSIRKYVWQIAGKPHVYWVLRRKRVLGKGVVSWLCPLLERRIKRLTLLSTYTYNSVVLIDENLACQRKFCNGWADINNQWSICEESMARIVLLQLATAFIVALLAGISGKVTLVLSALAGGLCCALPNAFFALRLFIGTKKPGGANPATFFVGEFIKIFLTLALMGAFVYWYRDVNWPAFLIAFIVVLKSYFILLFRQRP